MSMTSVILSKHSWLSLWRSLCETKTTLLSEWFRMLVTSFSELSGRMGMDTRPKAVVAKNARVQLGMLCDRMATLSPPLMP